MGRSGVPGEGPSVALAPGASPSGCRGPPGDPPHPPPAPRLAGIFHGRVGVQEGDSRGLSPGRGGAREGGVGDEWPRDRFQWRQEVGSGAWAWVFVGPPPTERTPPNPLTLNQLASKRPWRCCISRFPPRSETVHVPEVTFLALLWQRAGLGHLVVDRGAHGARAPPVRFVVDWDAALRVGGDGTTLGTGRITGAG